mmetsp:Transcript_24822/g.44979  ORF Transcript_24822/g.44979 Transcript_24822/m.44979 type:complete len:279 (+) Transcript_24822:546-1382(+)
MQIAYSRSPTTCCRPPRTRTPEPRSPRPAVRPSSRRGTGSVHGRKWSRPRRPPLCGTQSRTRRPSSVSSWTAPSSSQSSHSPPLCTRPASTALPAACGCWPASAPSSLPSPTLRASHRSRWPPRPSRRPAWSSCWCTPARTTGGGRTQRATRSCTWASPPPSVPSCCWGTAPTPWGRSSCRCSWTPRTRRGRRPWPRPCAWGTSPAPGSWPAVGRACGARTVRGAPRSTWPWHTTVLWRLPGSSRRRCLRPPGCTTRTRIPTGSRPCTWRSIWGVRAS